MSERSERTTEGGAVDLDLLLVNPLKGALGPSRLLYRSYKALESTPLGKNKGRRDHPEGCK